MDKKALEAASLREKKEASLKEKKVAARAREKTSTPNSKEKPNPKSKEKVFKSPGTQTQTKQLGVHRANKVPRQTVRPVLYSRSPTPEPTLSDGLHSSETDSLPDDSVFAHADAGKSKPRRSPRKPKRRLPTPPPQVSMSPERDLEQSVIVISPTGTPLPPFTFQSLSFNYKLSLSIPILNSFSLSLTHIYTHTHTFSLSLSFSISFPQSFNLSPYFNLTSSFNPNTILFNLNLVLSQSISWRLMYPPHNHY